MLAIIWTCCTATSAGNMADGSSEAEGSHMAGTSAGILRAEKEAVKESKQGRAEDSLTGRLCVTGVKKKEKKKKEIKKGH